MPLAKEFDCKVLQKTWLTPTVVGIRFEPSKRFKFDPGQFLSVIVPKPFAPPQGPKRLRRIYSLAAGPETGYELSIKITGGPGPAYLASLGKGDVFRASAPYGDFVYDPKPARGVCFISTGTGIAPFRAIIQSHHYQENRPLQAVSIFGARREEDILYRDEFARLGVDEIFAITHPEPHWVGFKGRVTDYLNQLPSDWTWHSTDFYICGNGDMVNEVKKTLLGPRGVSERSIYAEVYFSGRGSLKRTETALEQRKFDKTAA